MEEDARKEDDACWLPKLRKMHVTSIWGGRPMKMDDLNDNCAIVDRTFISRVCRERCRYYDCEAKEFADAGEALVVFRSCPFYVEAFMEDRRSK